MTPLTPRELATRFAPRRKAPAPRRTPELPKPIAVMGRYPATKIGGLVTTPAHVSLLFQCKTETDAWLWIRAPGLGGWYRQRGVPLWIHHRRFPANNVGKE